MVTQEEAAELVAALRASGKELEPFAEQAEAFSTEVLAAADRIEGLAAAGELEAVGSAVRELWRDLGELALTRALIAGSTRAFQPAQVPDQGTPRLERTPEAVQFLNRLVRQINERG